MHRLVWNTDISKHYALQREPLPSGKIDGNVRAHVATLLILVCPLESSPMYMLKVVPSGTCIWHVDVYATRWCALFGTWMCMRLDGAPVVCLRCAGTL